MLKWLLGHIMSNRREMNMTKDYVEMLTEAQRLSEDYKPKEKLYKKLTGTIKSFLLDNPNEFISNGKYFADMRTTHKNEVDEDGLIEFLQDNNLDEFIETKLVLDMDKLEGAIFNKKLPKLVLDNIGKFFTIKEGKALFISKLKDKED